MLKRIYINYRLEQTYTRIQQDITTTLLHPMHCNVRLDKSKKVVQFGFMFNRLPPESHSVNLNRFENVLRHWLSCNLFCNIIEYFNIVISVVFELY